MIERETVAAVDLGSNSFHMVIARRLEPELRIVDRYRERVQLAAGLDGKKRLGQEAQDRALACLSRMAQRLRDLPADRIRAVGTNTLRKARNRREFLQAAQDALGHSIEVVSGREEARLIYLGVAHSLADDVGRRLVVDIGGGSTECIIGERFEVLEADSLHMGCVSYSRRFFPDGRLERDAFRKATIAARLELQTLEQRFRILGWSAAVGASGTVRAIAQILQANGWAEHERITPQGLRRLRRAMLNCEHLDALALPGLSAERAPVLPGGLAILSAVFKTLEVNAMRPATGALREGLIYDLVGRIRHEDVRDRTIRRFVERFHVDLGQAARVERNATACLAQVREAWSLQGSSPRQLLVWAARLHEIGLVVSYASYHKHGAYLVSNSYMPGFSNEDQQLLAVLIRFHRRKLIPVEVPDLPPLGRDRTLRLIVLLRLAVLLSRNRSGGQAEVQVEAKKSKLKLSFPQGWLADHPLTQADLEQEAEQLSSRGFKLSIR